MSGASTECPCEVEPTCPAKRLQVNKGDSGKVTELCMAGERQNFFKWDWMDYNWELICMAVS